MSILFFKDSNGIISSNRWYWLKTDKYEDKNYLTFASTNIKLDVTKDNYIFNGYSAIESDVTLP